MKKMKKKFKILSIDGGGIKGVYPAQFLELIEAKLQGRTDGKEKLHQHFDLITGTSTGGIIALAIAMGIPAKEIKNLYLDNCKSIFGKKRSIIRRLFNAKHDNKFLEQLIRNKFKEYNNGNDPILNDCLTDVCIPIYDLNKGEPSVLKTRYHENFVRDYHIPIYQVAMATSAAPTYFNAYTSKYIEMDGSTEKIFANKIDGGVMANNPTLVALLEALKAFGKELSEIEVLSLGTGVMSFGDSKSRKHWGLKYWLNISSPRIFDLFMNSQSQLVDNYLSLLYQGIDKSEIANPNFVYDRITTILAKDNYIDMDEKDYERVSNYSELGSISFQEKGRVIMEKHFY
tara:strand:- start:395 stop:1423 length:1029 start_codon:yes stop_codon:yes gene_type:complete